MQRLSSYLGTENLPNIFEREEIWHVLSFSILFRNLVLVDCFRIDLSFGIHYGSISIHKLGRSIVRELL